LVALRKIPILWGELLDDQYVGDYFGTIEEYVNDCPSTIKLDPSVLSDAIKMEFNVYISSNAFNHFNFYPDDIAGVMIHEGTHTWQEQTA
jgi:hypothetical protein